MTSKRPVLPIVQLLFFCLCFWWSQPAAAAPTAGAAAASLIPEPQPVQIYIYRHRLWLAAPAIPPSGPKRENLPATTVRLPANRLTPLIVKYARKYGLDPQLVQLVIRQESGFNPTAVSPKGALGLMQLMPATAAELGVTDPFDVEQNLAGGIRYLKSCLDRFHGDLSLALAAYNAGPNRVAAQGGVPAIPETQVFVANILTAYQDGYLPGAKGLTLGRFSTLLPQPPLLARLAFKKVQVSDQPERD